MSTTRDGMGPTIIRASMKDDALRQLLYEVYGPQPAHGYPEWPHRTCSTCEYMWDHEPGDGGDACHGDTRVPGLTEWLDAIPPETVIRHVTDAPTPCPAWAPNWERVARRLLAERQAVTP